jgi:hypothetical protein
VFAQSTRTREAAMAAFARAGGGMTSFWVYRFGLKLDDATSLVLAFVHFAPINQCVCLPKLGYFFRKLVSKRGFDDPCSRNPIGPRSGVLGKHNGYSLRWLQGQSDFSNELAGRFQSPPPYLGRDGAASASRTKSLGAL